MSRNRFSAVCLAGADFWLASWRPACSEGLLLPAHGGPVAQIVGAVLAAVLLVVAVMVEDRWTFPLSWVGFHYADEPPADRP